MKITFIGAGSLGFFRRLTCDILSFPALNGCTLSLMDIDEKRLGYSVKIAERILREGNYTAKIEYTTERKKALEGADFVIVAILHGGIEVISKDINIPLKYGVEQCIGDTLGPGGVFRALRTIPVMLDICKDMEEICPDALLLNYTNPMAMLCWAMNKYSKIKVIGLCHSVQGTSELLAKYIGADYKDITYKVAGINHQAWFLEFKWKGKDAYPILREKINDKSIYEKDTTRCEMFKHLGYFVTESSGHNSEYNPWFRKRKDLLLKYTNKLDMWNGETGFILKLYGTDRENYEEQLKDMVSGKEPIDFTRTHEYGSYIINSIVTGNLTVFNGNVENRGLIENLPYGSIVEVPCLVDKNGIQPTYIGKLPTHLAAINRSNIAVQELAVEAAITGDKQKVFYAIALDPLTSAVLSLEEINSMVNEMFELEKEWLPQFKF